MTSALHGVHMPSLLECTLMRCVDVHTQPSIDPLLSALPASNGTSNATLS